MQRARFGFILVIALLALLPTSALTPVEADGGSLTKIALRGDILVLPPAPPYRSQQVQTLDDFGPVDVNDNGEIVFYAEYLELSDGQNVCGLLDSSGGAPAVVKASQDNSPESGQRYSFCPVLGITPLTNDDTASDIAFMSGLEPSLEMAIFVATGPSPYTFSTVVRQGATAPDGGTFGVPTLLDFNDDGEVLFHAPIVSGPYPEALFLGGGGGGATKLVAVNDTLTEAGGGTVTALGDASMNNDGDIVYKAELSGNTNGSEGILLVSGGTTTWVVGESDEWKLGNAYSGGEAQHAHTRFTDTFTSVGEPRINDNDQVSYYAQTAGGEEGFFIATPGSDYEQAKQATEDDPSILDVSGFNSFGGRGRHNLTDNGDIVVPGEGGDPIDGVLAFPSFHKIVIGGEIAPGTTGDVFQQSGGTFTLPVVSANFGKVGFKAETGSSGPGVWGGTIDLDDDDGDGILDEWEQVGGWDYNNDGTADLDLYSLGARPNHKDIFVEVDWMDCTVGTSDCEVGDTHDHQPTAGIIEDGTTGWSCDDGQDNGGDGPDVYDGLVDITDNGVVNSDDDGTLAGLEIIDGFLDIDDDGDHDANDDGIFAGHKVIDGQIDVNDSGLLDSGDDGTLGDEADPDCAVVTAFARAPVSNLDGQDGVRLHVLIDEALPHSRFMNFGGSLLEDPDSATPGPCNDGKDNGNDGGCDGAGCGALPADSDCTGGLVREVSQGNTTGTCNNGSDDDGDTLIDFADQDCTPTDFDSLKSFGSSGDSKQTLAAKTRVFHYTIFAHSLFPDNTATPLWEDTISGYAEMPGNDLIVSLGEWDFTAGEQEGTFMHELGHNLGLDHGGGDSMNYKPNYLSVMNYTFQMPNIVSDRPLDYSRWVLPLPDNEDNQSALNTCNDNIDNGPEGACDVAGGCGAGLPADLDCQPFLQESRPTEDQVAGNTCDDGIDNGHGDGADEADGDCQGGLDEGRGIDGNMAPEGLSNWSTAYTYLRIDDNNQASCPFAVVDAVGDIDWDVDGTYNGISLDSANTGAGISDPDPGPSAPQAALCLNSTSILQGYNDWANLKYAKGIALSPDFSVNDHFTQPPEMAQKRLPDTDTDGIVDMVDNCPDDSNAGQEDSDGDLAGDACDNCPGVYNQTQTNTDGHDKGDACDPDDDDDGWSDAQENVGGSGGAGAGDTEGSDPLDDSATPEVCDGVDNDGNEGVDEGFPDANSDDEADCVEDDAGECTAPHADCDVDGDDQLNGPDPDCDDANNGAHFSDAEENYMGTDPCVKCGQGNDPYDTASPYDAAINTLDLFAFVTAQALGGAIADDNANGNYSSRFDLNQAGAAKGVINTLDLFVYVNKAVLGDTCGVDY
jgi:hypothetical protein